VFLLGPSCRAREVTCHYGHAHRFCYLLTYLLIVCTAVNKNNSNKLVLRLSLQDNPAELAPEQSAILDSHVAPPTGTAHPSTPCRSSPVHRSGKPTYIITGMAHWKRADKQWFYAGLPNNNVWTGARVDISCIFYTAHNCKKS